MDIEEPGAQSLKQKAEALQRLSTGSLSSSVSKLSYSSRSIPVDRDFHFYYNFDEFKAPVKEISDKTQLLLERVGMSSRVWGKRLALPDDLDDAYDWLVNANDEIFERFDVSLDEFQSSRKREEEGSSMPAESSDGFQLVYGKKKKKGFVDARNAVGLDSSARTSVSAGDAGMKVTLKDTRVVTGVKSRVPFHIPTIPRPQDVFKILVNNSNQPFQHVWLQRSEDDDETLVHPLEKHSVSDFVDRNIESIVPVEPPSLECTPFKLVEEVKDLKELAAKLRAANEFAVDLEHNQYRTFQGMTCLMQVSTRSEDFIVDTLKLRIHVGPHLREVFKDPSKRKVMHGADRDILWLQRDFGIYVCNLFDTGQASRVLKLERNSLEHLLSHFCGVTADKEYQNADWRLRPLPHEMLKYAREDTHYLLYIYDLMRVRLLSASTESEYSDNLLEVYKRSSDICMQLYEKELLTETSYLHIYGLQESDFNAQQLAIVAGLCEWRDVIARAEDESTGYILPNRTLLEIAKQMPGTTSKLRRLIKSKHPYVERNLAAVISIIHHSVLDASAFEAAAEELKAHRLERASGENMGTDGSEATQSETSINLKTNAGAENSGANKINSSVSAADLASSQVRNGPIELEGSEAEVNRDGKRCSSVLPGEKEVKMDISSGQARDVITETSVPTSTKVTGAAVRLLKKPSSAFGALLGNSVSKKNSDVDTKGMKQMKLEQIKSTVNLPFYSFSGNERTKPVAKEATEVPKSFHEDDPVETASSGLEDIILLDANTGTEHPRVDDSNGVNEILESEEKKTAGPDSDVEPMSLSDLSSSFQECCQSINKNKTSNQVKSFQESNGLLQLKPFDYEAARKEIRFGESGEKKMGEDCNEDGRGGHMKQGVGVGQRKKNGGATELAQGKRRQAFPASGNRSVTFR